MRVLILLKVVCDAAVPVLVREETGRIREEWNVKTLNPFDLSCLQSLRNLKDRVPNVRVTVVHLGPQENDVFLLEALSFGCDSAIRVWDDDLSDMCLSSRAKAFILERVARIWGFDLLLAGARSADNSSGQVPLLLAKRLSVPCVVDVVEIEEVSEGKMRVLKALERGKRRRIEVSLPAILAVGCVPAKRHAPLGTPLVQKGEVIEVLSLSDLGITRELIRGMGNLEGLDRLLPPRPKLRQIEAPPSYLHAFDRIQRLVQGEIKARGGRIVKGGKEEIAEMILSFLIEEGWLRGPKGQG